MARKAQQWTRALTDGSTRSGHGAHSYGGGDTSTAAPTDRACDRLAIMIDPAP